MDGFCDVAPRKWVLNLRNLFSKSKSKSKTHKSSGVHHHSQPWSDAASLSSSVVPENSSDDDPTNSGNDDHRVQRSGHHHHRRRHRSSRHHHRDHHRGHRRHRKHSTSSEPTTSQSTYHQGMRDGYRYAEEMNKHRAERQKQHYAAEFMQCEEYYRDCAKQCYDYGYHEGRTEAKTCNSTGDEDKKPKQATSPKNHGKRVTFQDVQGEDAAFRRAEQWHGYVRDEE